MKALMIKAHRMTRKIVEKYGDVDYKVQFGLCLSYLIEEEGTKERLPELKGSVKQIAWAEDLRAGVLDYLDNIEPIDFWAVKLSKHFWYEHRVKLPISPEDIIGLVANMKKVIMSKTESTWFINNRRSLVYKNLAELIEGFMLDEYKVLIEAGHYGENYIETNFTEENSEIVKFSKEDYTKEERLELTYKALKEGKRVIRGYGMARAIQKRVNADIMQEMLKIFK